MSDKGSISFNSSLSVWDSGLIPLRAQGFSWNGINPVEIPVELLNSFSIDDLVSLGDGSYLLRAAPNFYRLTAIFPICLDENKIAFNVSIEAYK